MNQNKEKQQVLILHGWGGSKQSWQACVNEFDKDKYELFVPDLPGFGANPAPTKSWSVDDYAHYVSQLMKEYKLEKPVCIAHSFGGRIAIKLASNHKDIFSKLVLVAAAGIKREASFKVRLFAFISKFGKAILNVFGLKMIEKKARRILHKIAGAHDYSKTEGTMKETFKMVIEEDLTGLLKNINTTTYIIWGDKDSYVPVSDAHIMNTQIAHSKLKVFAGGKHGLHLQMPKELAETISSFIDNAHS